MLTNVREDLQAIKNGIAEMLWFVFSVGLVIAVPFALAGYANDYPAYSFFGLACWAVAILLLTKDSGGFTPY